MARFAGWASRRPVRAGTAVVATLAVVATVLVGVPQWVSGHERAEVLGAVPFVGAVRVLDSAPRARWSAVVDGSVAPVLAGDVVVVTAGEPSAGRRLVGLDVVSGAQRWTVDLDAAHVPERVQCRPLESRVVCVVGPAPPPDRGLVPALPSGEAGASELLVIDPARGTVLSRSDVRGWVVATATVGADLVVATYAWGMLTVRRLDPGTGGVRWETERWSTFRSAGNGRVALVAAAGLVMAAGNDVTTVLDARTGERLPRPDDASVADQVRLLDDGTLVRTRYRDRAAGADPVSLLSTGVGEPWLSVRGACWCSG